MHIPGIRPPDIYDVPSPPVHAVHSAAQAGTYSRRASMLVQTIAANALTYSQYCKQISSSFLHFPLDKYSALCYNLIMKGGNDIEQQKKRPQESQHRKQTQSCSRTPKPCDRSHTPV